MASPLPWLAPNLGAAHLASTAAFLAAFTFFCTRKKTQFITDYSKVATEVGSEGRDVDEYDYIIVGGGMIRIHYSRFIA